MQSSTPGLGLLGALTALGAILSGLLIAGDVRGVDNEMVDESAVDVAVQAKVSAENLADSLRSLEGSMQTTDPSVKVEGTFTAADNDALIEAAAKAQLSGIADDLDLLSSMLAAGADAEETKPLLQNLTQRAAILGRLGQRTSQPLIPTAQQQALMQLWREVEALSVSSPAVDAIPVADPEVEVPN